MKKYYLLLLLITLVGGKPTEPAAPEKTIIKSSKDLYNSSERLLLNVNKLDSLCGELP